MIVINIHTYVYIYIYIYIYIYKGYTFAKLQHKAISINTKNIFSHIFT